MKRILLIICTLFISLAVVYAQSPIELTTEKDDEGNYYLFADNQGIIPAYVFVSFPTFTNMAADKDLPYGELIPPGQKIQILHLWIADKSKSSRYRMSYTSVQGDPINTVPDDDYLYLFPWEHGHKHKVTQGHNGTFTHMDENQYALDFDLDMKTPIAAAREGLVVDVKEDSNRGGASSSFSKYGNYVQVYHSDGTFANYVHLVKDGALVQVGETVEQGQIIALSGNTGRSSGPHLHFDVSVPLEDGSRTSIPVKFADHENNAVIPQEGSYYYSLHPDGEAVEVVFGDAISHEDYADFSQPFQGDETVTVRSEEVDDTVILFLQNGYDRDVKVEMSLQLTGMTASIPVKSELFVQANTEVFMCILKTKKDASRFGYGYRYKIFPQ